MSGYNVLDTMKNLFPPDLPVIYISAKPSVNDKCEGLRHLCHDYQTNPFEKDELSHRVKAFIVLRKLRLLELQKSAQLESLCATAPSFIVDKFKSGTTAITERLQSVNVMDFYIPLP